MFELQAVNAVPLGKNRFAVVFIFEETATGKPRRHDVRLATEFGASSARDLVMAINRRCPAEWRWKEVPTHLAEYNTEPALYAILRTTRKQ